MSSIDVINNLADFYYENQENLSADTVNYYLHNNLIVTNRDPNRQLRQLKSSLLTHCLREQHIEGNLVPQMQRIIRVTNDPDKTLYIEYQTHNLASQNSMLPLVSPRYIKQYMPHIFTNTNNYTKLLELEKQYHADMRKIRYQFQCDQYLGLLRAGIHFPIKDTVNHVPVWPPQAAAQPMSTIFNDYSTSAAPQPMQTSFSGGGGGECPKPTQQQQPPLFQSYPIQQPPQQRPATQTPFQTYAPPPTTQQQAYQPAPGQGFPMFGTGTSSFPTPAPTTAAPQNNSFNSFTLPQQQQTAQPSNLSGFSGLNPQAPLNTSFGTPSAQSGMPFPFTK